MTTRILVPAVTLASMLLLVGCEKQEPKAPEPIRPVLSSVLEPNRSDSAVVVGDVEPRYQTDLAFRVLGRLTSRPFYVGDLISKGQTVATIDPTALELAVRHEADRGQCRAGARRVRSVGR
jgi:multidrug efflux pump subunit AcrA (membrane-fusion protein)